MKPPVLLIASLLCLPAVAFPQQPAQPQTPLPAPPPRQADDDAWNRLSWLPPDTEVSVSGPHRFPFRCASLQVTDDGLSCESHSIWTPSRYLDLPRSEVRNVSIRHDRRDLWIGFAAMSTLGFVAGASKSSYRIENGLVGAALVDLVSAPFVITLVRFLPGHTLYEPGFSAAVPKQTKLPRKTHAFLARLSSRRSLAQLPLDDYKSWEPVTMAAEGDR